MSIEFRVANTHGASFNLHVRAGARLADLKEAIEVHTGYDPISQRLVLAENGKELRGNGALRDSLAGLALDSVVELELLRRTSDEVLWLQRLERQGQNQVKRWLGKQPPAMRADREAMLAAVAIDGGCLQFASEGLKADPEVVLAAAAMELAALKFASLDLRADRDFILAAVTQDGYALRYADEELRADRDIVLAAVTKNGGALAHADPDLQDDKEVVIAAVSTYGHALYHASPELRADREVVMAAVTQDHNALEYATADLRADKELVRITRRALTQSSL